MRSTSRPESRGEKEGAARPTTVPGSTTSPGTTSTASRWPSRRPSPAGVRIRAAY
jgi:hypothetical protein